MGKSEFDSIQTRAEQGREFEESEKREWRDQANVFEEHAIEYPPGVTNGRIDVYIDDGGFHSIIEIKSSNWDRTAPHRVRPNVMRHKRQVIKYVWWYWDQGKDTAAALIYPTAPKTPGRRELIESILEDWSIQCIWKDERD